MIITKLNPPLTKRNVIITSRNISDSIVFNAVAKKNNKNPSLNPKLKVPLLKSPSHFGHYTSRVSRLYNEDKYSANVLDINGNTVFNFNIFDGHGGDQCAIHLQNNLSNDIELATQLLTDEQGKDDLIKKYAKNVGGYWKRWYRQRKDNFVKMVNTQNELDLESLKGLKDDYHLRLPLSFLNSDYNFFEKQETVAGSTCTSVLLETVYTSQESNTTTTNTTNKYYFENNTMSKLTIGHVGDTKAIIVDKYGDAHALTQAHHPSNPIEASRLRKYAANFFMTDSFGEERFISLANTRAFGDVDFKQMGVTAEPDVAQLIIGDYNTIHSQLTPSEIKDNTIGGIGGDESFIILCSDGVSNEITDQETADIIMNTFNMRGHKQAMPQVCAEEVIKFIEYIGGDDNATCLVIRLNGWGKWPVKDRTGELRQERMEDSFRKDDR